MWRLNGPIIVLEGALHMPEIMFRNKDRDIRRMVTSLIMIPHKIKNSTS